MAGALPSPNGVLVAGRQTCWEQRRLTSRNAAHEGGEPPALFPTALRCKPARRRPDVPWKMNPNSMARFGEAALPSDFSGALQPV